jgi:hypothetical protein
MSRAEWEKKAITIKLTWPTFLIMRLAPNRNGMLLSVPTVSVRPVGFEIRNMKHNAKTSLLVYYFTSFSDF